MPFAEVGKLQIAEDIAFQRREWALERVGWVLMLALVVAAGGGLLGTGPVSSTSASSADGRLTVRYERFVHRQAPTELRVRYGANAAQEGKVRLVLDSSYVGKLKIDRVRPEPEKVEIGGGRYTYVFSADDGPGEATFAMQLEGFGRVAGEVSLAGERVAVRQFAYP